MTTHRDRLAQIVRARRLQIGLSVARAAKLARIDRVTWTRAENGDAIEEVSAAKMEQVLSWAPGSIASILNGGQPTEVERPEPEPQPGATSRRIPVLTRDEQARLDAEIARIDGMALPAATKLQLTELLLRRWDEYAAERAASRWGETA